MERGKNAKTASLIIVAVLILLHVMEIPAAAVSAYRGGPFYTRFTYQFFHASWIHLAINVWTFLYAVFIYNLKIPSLVVAFIISVIVPLSATPTVGLSGIVFALYGFISFRFKNKILYHSWMMFFILIGFFFHNINALLHLYCYLTAILVHYEYAFCRRNIK